MTSKPPPRLAPEQEFDSHSAWLEYRRAEAEKRHAKDMRTSMLIAVAIFILTFLILWGLFTGASYLLHSL